MNTEVLLVVLFGVLIVSAAAGSSPSSGLNFGSSRGLIGGSSGAFNGGSSGGFNGGGSGAFNGGSSGAFNGGNSGGFNGGGSGVVNGLSSGAFNGGSSGGFNGGGSGVVTGLSSSAFNGGSSGGYNGGGSGVVTGLSSSGFNAGGSGVMNSGFRGQYGGDSKAFPSGGGSGYLVNGVGGLPNGGGSASGSALNSGGFLNQRQLGGLGYGGNSGGLQNRVQLGGLLNSNGQLGSPLNGIGSGGQFNGGQWVGQSSGLFNGGGQVRSIPSIGQQSGGFINGGGLGLTELNNGKFGGLTNGNLARSPDVSSKSLASETLRPINVDRAIGGDLRGVIGGSLGNLGGQDGGVLGVSNLGNPQSGSNMDYTGILNSEGFREMLRRLQMGQGKGIESLNDGPVGDLLRSQNGDGLLNQGNGGIGLDFNGNVQGGFVGGGGIVPGGILNRGQSDGLYNGGGEGGILNGGESGGLNFGVTKGLLNNGDSGRLLIGGSLGDLNGGLTELSGLDLNGNLPKGSNFGGLGEDGSPIPSTSGEGGFDASKKDSNGADDPNSGGAPINDALQDKPEFCLNSATDTQGTNSGEDGGLNLQLEAPDSTIENDSSDADDSDEYYYEYYYDYGNYSQEDAVQPDNGKATLQDGQKGEGTFVLKGINLTGNATGQDMLIDAGSLSGELSVKNGGTIQDGGGLIKIQNGGGLVEIQDGEEAIDSGNSTAIEESELAENGGMIQDGGELIEIQDREDSGVSPAVEESDEELLMDELEDGTLEAEEEKTEVKVSGGGKKPKKLPLSLDGLLRARVTEKP